MATAHIAFETQTGRILLFHRFEDEPVDTQPTLRNAARLTAVEEAAMTVISVPVDEIDPERNYKINSSRDAMIETAAGEAGIRFGIREVRPAE
jgi:hypothetical protein